MKRSWTVKWWRMEHRWFSLRWSDVASLLSRTTFYLLYFIFFTVSSPFSSNVWTCFVQGRLNSDRVYRDSTAFSLDRKVKMPVSGKETSRDRDSQVWKHFLHVVPHRHGAPPPLSAVLKLANWLSAPRTAPAPLILTDRQGRKWNLMYKFEICIFTDRFAYWLLFTWRLFYYVYIVFLSFFCFRFFNKLEGYV